MSEPYSLTLTERQAQALFRATIEYRRLLKLSELKDSLTVSDEVAAIDAISGKLSLEYFYPKQDAAA